MDPDFAALAWLRKPHYLITPLDRFTALAEFGVIVLVFVILWYLMSDKD